MRVKNAIIENVEATGMVKMMERTSTIDDVQRVTDKGEDVRGTL